MEKSGRSLWTLSMESRMNRRLSIANLRTSLQFMRINAPKDDKMHALVMGLCESCLGLLSDWPGENLDRESVQASRKESIEKLGRLLTAERPPRDSVRAKQTLLLADSLRVITEQWRGSNPEDSSKDHAERTTRDMIAQNLSDAIEDIPIQQLNIPMINLIMTLNEMCLGLIRDWPYTKNDASTRDSRLASLNNLQLLIQNKPQPESQLDVVINFLADALLVISQQWPRFEEIAPSTFHDAVIDLLRAESTLLSSTISITNSPSTSTVSSAVAASTNSTPFSSCGQSTRKSRCPSRFEQAMVNETMKEAEIQRILTSNGKRTSKPPNRYAPPAESKCQRSEYDKNRWMRRKYAAIYRERNKTKDEDEELDDDDDGDSDGDSGDDNPKYRGPKCQRGKNRVVRSAIALRGLRKTNYSELSNGLSPKRTKEVPVMKMPIVFNNLVVLSGKERQMRDIFFANLRQCYKYRLYLTMIKGSTEGAFFLPGGNEGTYSSFISKKMTVPNFANKVYAAVKKFERDEANAAAALNEQGEMMKDEEMAIDEPHGRVHLEESETDPDDQMEDNDEDEILSGWGEDEDERYEEDNEEGVVKEEVKAEAAVDPTEDSARDHSSRAADGAVISEQPRTDPNAHHRHGYAVTHANKVKKEEEASEEKKEERKRSLKEKADDDAKVRAVVKEEKKEPDEGDDHDASTNFACHMGH